MTDLTEHKKDALTVTNPSLAEILSSLNDADADIGEYKPEFGIEELRDKVDALYYVDSKLKFESERFK